MPYNLKTLKSTGVKKTKVTTLTSQISLDLERVGRMRQPQQNRPQPPQTQISKRSVPQTALVDVLREAERRHPGRVCHSVARKTRVQSQVC